MEDPETGYTIREGGIVGEAIILEEGEGLKQFQDEADFIKECYGYYPEAMSSDDENLFSAFRHPAYPDDIMAVFPAPEGRWEKMWVTELEKEENGAIKATLLNEPYNEQIGVHEGDIVTVVALDLGEGAVTPTAIIMEVCLWRPEQTEDSMIHIMISITTVFWTVESSFFMRRMCLVMNRDHTQGDLIGGNTHGPGKERASEHILEHSFFGFW